MNLLLDECLPKKLKRDLHPHLIATVTEMGWAGKKNGELLTLAAKRFDVFITGDQNLEYQQNLHTSKIPVMVLSVRRNDYQSFKKLCPKILRHLSLSALSGIIRIF